MDAAGTIQERHGLGRSGGEEEGIDVKVNAVVQSARRSHHIWGLKTGRRLG